MTDDFEVNLVKFRKSIKYRCLCSCCHVKSVSLIMSIISLSIIFLNLLTKALDYSPASWNWEALFFIVDGIAVVSLIFGIVFEKPCLIQPFVVLSLITIPLLFLLGAFFITAIQDQESFAAHYIEAEFIRKFSRNFKQLSSSAMKHHNQTCHFLKSTSFDLSSIPSSPKHPSNLTICSTSKSTCCTTFLEDQMTIVIKQKIEHKLQDQIYMMRDFFERHLISFKQTLRDQLLSNKFDLDQMFTKTYGPFYKSNAEIFETFYNDLDSYLYSSSFQPLPHLIDTFFERTYLKMFELLNPLKKIETDEQEICLKKMRHDLKPFGPFPKRINVQLSKSLTVWRTFFEVIAGIVDQLHSLLDTKIPTKCLTELVQMQLCPICTLNQLPSSSTKPCANYCSNVLRGCLAEYAEIDAQWMPLIDSLNQVLTRLRDVANPIQVLAPLPAQISQAIMNFQERGAEISSRLIINCFENAPIRPLARHKREMDEYVGSELVFTHKSNSIKKKKDINVVGRMIDNFSDQLKRMRSFWKTLPTNLCGEIGSKENKHCWSGSEVTAIYKYKVIGEGVKRQKYNPEFKSQHLFLSLSKETFLNERIKFVVFGDSLDKSINSYKRNEVVEGSGKAKEVALSKSILEDDEDNDEYEGSGMEMEPQMHYTSESDALSSDSKSTKSVASSASSRYGHERISGLVVFLVILPLASLSLLLKMIFH
uniref:Glypican-6 n=1 Tax=Rhabditophanes sp. KR3021 TaxID=114890 RepID=A0AC35UAV0_9BILA